MKLIDTKMHRPDHSRKESCGLPSILRSCSCGAPDAYRRKRNVTYNPRSELTNAAMGTNQYGFVFDNIGNRETYTNNAETLTYFANELNQYTNIANGITNTPTYDLDGNMLTHNGWTYSRNGENRLVKSESLSSTPGEFTVCVENEYDYMGRRVRKTVKDDYSGGSYTTTNVTTYAWDGWNIIAEMCDAGYTNFNTWGIDVFGTLQGAGGVGGLLAVTRVTGAETNTYFPCFDGNGNVCQYIDENGSVVAAREYSPFGTTIALTGDKKDDFTHWWSTKPWDAETKQSKYQQRDYLPEIGRFGSRDPLDEPAFATVLKSNLDKDIFRKIYFEDRLDEMRQIDPLYVFVQNDPISGVDYLGLTTSSGGCCGPDITTPFDATLANIRSTYDGWRTRQKWSACIKVYNVLDNSHGGVAMAWDIKPLFNVGGGTLASIQWSGTIDGSGQNCGFTVAYHQKCYNAGYLNYIMWGVINQRCNRSFRWMTPGSVLPLPWTNPWSRGNALATATLYKAGVNRNPGGLPEVLSAVTAGYRSSGGCAPAISTHTQCAIQSANKVNSSAAFGWVWEPVQNR